MSWDNIGSTLAGGLISAVVAFLTLRGTLGNQLSLEDRRFQNQQRLDAESREHEASAFRRLLLRTFRRLHNTARMDPKIRTSVHAWKNITKALENLLESHECPKSLDDARYEAAWRTCGESRAAIMFLEVWAANQQGTNVEVVLLSFREYYKALETCFQAFGDDENATTVREAINRNFKGTGFWMTSEYGEAVYPNP